MKKQTPIDYLETNKLKISSEYSDTKEKSEEQFEFYFQNMQDISRKLKKNLGSREIIDSLLNIGVENYSPKLKFLFIKWLFNAFDEELLHFHVLDSINEYDLRKDETSTHHQFHSHILNSRNKDLFDKKYGLYKCDTYIEKRKFLEKCATLYLEKYSLALNDLLLQIPMTNNSAYPGLSDKEFFHELYKTTINEKKLLDKKEETRLFEENNNSYFIHEDILGQLFYIFKSNELLDERDEKRFLEFLKYGSTLNRKIKIFLTGKQLTHSFYLLMKDNLISINSVKVLSNWLFASFELQRSFGKESPYLPDTLRKYINMRRKIETGEEIFKVVPLNKTKNGPKYVLEEVHID